MENEELMEAVKAEMEKRVQALLQGDPEFQRLRGMLDVLEGKLSLRSQDEEASNEMAEKEGS
jgi:hypothetical protein